MEYRKAATNNVVDALSKKGAEEEVTLALITFLTIDWMDELKEAYSEDEKLKKPHRSMQNMGTNNWLCS